MPGTPRSFAIGSTSSPSIAATFNDKPDLAITASIAALQPAGFTPPALLTTLTPVRAICGRARFKYPTKSGGKPNAGSLRCARASSDMVTSARKSMTR